jgi:hypothetical protein
MVAKESSNSPNICVYRLADINSKTLRIGITNNLERRASQHRKDGLGFASIEKLSGPYATEEEAQVQEGRAFLNHWIIYKEVPKHNNEEEALKRITQFIDAIQV